MPTVPGCRNDNHKLMAQVVKLLNSRFFLFLLVLVIALGLAGCNGPTPQADHSPQRVLYFPQHDEPLETDKGGRYFFGTLIARDGCLRFDYSDVNSPDYTLLPVWPAGFSVNFQDGSIRVIDSSGLFVAQVGDDVRFSGRSIGGNTWVLTRDGPDPEWRPQTQRKWRRQLQEWQQKDRELQQRFSVECPGPFLIVGDEVSAVGPDEPTVISVPGSTVFLVREKSRRGGKSVTLAYYYPRELVLDGDCLRLRYEEDRPGWLVSWPAGFTPHFEGDQVEIRNGGGKTVARIGDMLEMSGLVGSEEHNLYSTRCPGSIFHGLEMKNLTLDNLKPLHDRK